MVSPTIKEPTGTTDGGLQRWGGPDAVHAAKLLKGTHATEKIQSSAIETLQTVLTYNATLAFDLDLKEQTLAVTGDLSTLSTSNRAAGKSKTVFIIGDTVNRTLTFHTSWRTNPSDATVTITANTFGVLTFGCKGTAETDVFCAYAEFG